VKEERGPWYLLTGCLLGIALGVLYAWVISPVEYVDTSPATLRSDFKDSYRALIAVAFVENGNLPRAQARLGLLGDTDELRTLAEQAQRTLAEGRSPDEARALGLLAVALGGGPTPVIPTPTPSLTPTTPPSETPVPFTATATVTPTLTISGTLTTATQPGETATVSPSASPTPSRTLPATRTPLPTGTPLPTRTASPTPGAPFLLQDRTFVCDQKLKDPLIQVLTENAAGDPVAGVEVIVNWDGGEDHFFTGLKPELGQGYADMTMTPGVVYTLHLADGGEIVSDLTPAECEAETGSRYWGSWLLVFTQH
jgi:hypothetical protein